MDVERSCVCCFFIEYDPVDLLSKTHPIFEKSILQRSEEEYMAMAARWFDGLISQNVEITKEVYSLQSVDFDRQVS